MNTETKGFTGLKGTSDVQKAQDKLSSLARDNLWYEPRKDEQVSMTTEPSNKDESSSTPWWNPGSFSDAVNRMLSPGYSSTWAQFASTKWYGERKSDDGLGYLSLEYIHNNVHVGPNFFDLRGSTLLKHQSQTEYCRGYFVG